jgi:hypothetical protein
MWEGSPDPDCIVRVRNLLRLSAISASETPPTILFWAKLLLPHLATASSEQPGPLPKGEGELELGVIR